MKKEVIVLDASVILADPQAIFKFGDREVVIPIAVIEDLDNVKKGIESRAINAREAVRLLDSLKGDFRRGIPLASGGTLRIETNYTKSIMPFDEEKTDNRILSTCYGIAQNHPDQRVVLVSRNPWLRLKCRALNIEARDYEGDVPKDGELYTGHIEIEVPASVIDELHQNRLVHIDHKLYPWQFVTLRAIENSSLSGLGYYDPKTKRIKKLWVDKNTIIYGIRPRNKEQAYALEMLLNPDVPLVTINGVAGTGKNIISIAAGLELVKTQQRKHYDKVLLTKRTVPMGKEAYEQQGFLPGGLNEKISPWMKSYVDTIDYLHRDRKSFKGSVIDELIQENIISIEVLTYLRGRSISRQFFIVDEAQNLDPHQIITILTRASEGTKIVLLGDVHQIDTPYLDTYTNGLSVVINNFKESERAAHITLQSVERDGIVQEVIDRILIPAR